MSILRKLKRLLINKKKVTNISLDNLILLMDAGASNWKTWFDGILGTGKSSIIEITKEEKGTQGNVIEINNKFFAVGNRNVNCSMEILKHKKEFIENIIIYALCKLHDKKGNVEQNKLYEIDMFLLLPYNQLTYINEWQSKFSNKIFEVTPNLGITRKYKINLREVLPEGGMSRYYLDDRLLKNRRDVIISDWGYSTIDNVPFWGEDREMDEGVPCNRAIRDLMVRHNFHIKRKSPDILATLYNGGKYVIPKENRKGVATENINFINSIIEEMELSVLGEADENDTSIVFCGGGSIMLHDYLIDFFNSNDKYKKFNLVFLSEEESVYSNVLGMGKYVKKFFLGKETDNTRKGTGNIKLDIPIGNNKIGTQSEAENIIVEITNKVNLETEELPKEEIQEHKNFEIIKNEEMEAEVSNINRKGNSDNNTIEDSETYINIVEEIGNGNLTDDRKVELIYILESMHKKQKEIAMLFDVSTKTIRNWKNNKKLSIIK